MKPGGYAMKPGPSWVKFALPITVVVPGPPVPLWVSVYGVAHEGPTSAMALGGKPAPTPGLMLTLVARATLQASTLWMAALALSGVAAKLTKLGTGFVFPIVFEADR